MYNVNGPPRGANVSSDQSSYDLLYKDFIIDSSLGTFYNDVYSYNLQTDNINKVYKAEMISATIVFDSSGIPTNIKNSAAIISISQLNGNTTRIAGNRISGNSSQGSNNTQGSIFCQIPDNNTPLTNASVISNNTISLLIGPHMYESVQYYNPPISNINRLDVQITDLQANVVSPTFFYFTVRMYYFQKRNNTTAFSTPVVNFMSGSDDSAFVPFNKR